MASLSIVSLLQMGIHAMIQRMLSVMNEIVEHCGFDDGFRMVSNVLFVGWLVDDFRLECIRGNYVLMINKYWGKTGANH